MSAPTPESAPPGTIDYVAIEESPRFVALKRTHRSFVLPMAAFFLVWYFVYVLLSSFAPEFMAQPVFGLINVGLLMGLGQFVTTFVITMWYVSFANKKLDPISTEIRTELEAQEAGR